MEQGTKRKVRIAVIGGGITGLCAAYYSGRMYREAGFDPEVTLLEASDRLGGKIKTLRRDGFVIERGPDSFLARKLPIIELSRELGIENELVTLNPKAKKTYIVSRGKLHLMPAGLVLGVPTQWKPFTASTLISPLGKLRAALDLLLPASKREGDESLGGFLRRRLGRELVDRVAEPLLSGIYAGDAYRISLQATFPQFRAAEKQYGSLIVGLGRGAGASRGGAVNEEAIPEHARGSVFLSYRRGLSALIERLEEQIREDGGRIRLRTNVLAVRRNGEAQKLDLSDGDPLEADVVIMTVPPPLLAGLLPEVPEAQLFADMEYGSVANIVFGYRKSEFGVPLDGSGFVVPRSEGRLITACTWTSSKWSHTAPEDGVLIRCYVGRIGDERWMAMDDETLQAEVQNDMRELMGIQSVPGFVDITRLPKSMPQYRVGHPERIETLRRALAQSTPGVYATGAGFQGVGLPDCIQQARETVRMSLRPFSEASTNRA